MRRKAQNLRGLLVGRLRVVGPGLAPPSGGTYWRCVCRCGKRVDVRGTLLTGPKQQSCGCLSREMLITRNRTHGLGSTREAAIWRAMIARCHNTNCRAYRWYGARGIMVCDRWRESFEAFLADVGAKPEGCGLDRIDNDGPYSPENCRWATVKENQRNRRGNVRITFNGETKTIAEWSELTSIPYSTLWKRLRLGWSPERMLTQPVR